jgi:hypothetical protein
MLNIDTRTADKKTTYSTFCRAIAIRAVHPHSKELLKPKPGVAKAGPASVL